MQAGCPCSLSALYCCTAIWCRDGRSGFISLTAIPRFRAGLRGDGLTGRRAVALAAPLWRGCPWSIAASRMHAGAVRRHWDSLDHLSPFRSRLFHAIGVGLRGGGLTGRRAVALAAPLWRGCSCSIAASRMHAGAVRRHWDSLDHLSPFRSRLFHAIGVGLRGGGLTGRRAVALAAPLWRGCLGHIGNRAV